MNREELVVVGWSNPEGSRHRIGALLLGYYPPEGKLIYAGRAGTGMSDAELERLWQRLQPLTGAEDASRRSAATRHPVWIAAARGAEPHSLHLRKPGARARRANCPQA